ncbi:MAG: DUF11 domain-containing protein, partial [Thermomicrobiales bacterium]|nr:DUF11 domain-containing protein [Thermomicrobiales bacterium]
AAVLRILITFVFLSGLLAPFTTFDVRADEDTSSQPTSGILQVVLQAGDTGQRLTGACWDVYDVNGEKHPYCDFDADGMTSFELVPGAVTVQQTGGPAGYVSTGAGHGSVVAGEIRTLTIVSAVEAAPVAMTLAQEQPATPEVTTTDETGSGAEGDLAEEADPTPEPPAETPTPEPTAIPDTDGDGVLDDADNCVNVANPDQADADENGIGDLCDIVETPTEEPTVEPTATPTEEPATPEASDPSFKLTVKVIDAETEKETTKVDLNRNRDVFFEYTIENTGNVPLTDLKIENTIEGLGQVTCEPDVTTIEPGEILVCAAPYTVTPADGHALFFANDISVSLRFADEVLEQAATTKTDSMFVLEPDAENGGSVGGGFSLAAVDPNAPPESFADAVVSWNVPNGGRGRYDDCYVSGLAPGIAFPSFSGILGVPDSNADINDNVNYSRLDSRAPAIGNGGEIVVQFINNRLVADPTVSGDLMIVERGTLAEEADIYIGNSASGPWIYVGSLSGDTNASEQRFNINGRPGVADWSEWSYVRIVDNPDQGLGNQGCRVNNDPASPDNGRTFNVDGPDLDAVWAISSANASLTKVGDKEWVSAVGEIVNYTFTVRNVGSAPLVFHTITDTIIPWNQISCPAPMPRSLSPGQNIVCTASHTTTAADVARGYVTNVAYANLKTLSGTDVQTEEDDWTYRVRADITVSKVAVNTPILPGGSAQFDITVTNKTAVPALQVTLVDTLPANVSAWSENSTACSISGTGSNPRVLNCSWPSIPGNGSVTVRVTMTAATSGCNPIINQLATVAAWNEHADQQADNTAGPATIEVTCPIQDIQVTKTAPNTTVNPGSSIVYTVSARNNGPSAISASGTSSGSEERKNRFLIRDTLPTGYNWTISENKSNFSCEPSSNVAGGTIVECFPNSSNFSISANETITITVTSTTNASTDACGNFLNRVTVSSNAESANAPQDNKSAEATVNVPCQDVGIVKSATNATINVGEPISYTIAATNNGPSSITTSGISGGGASATRVGRFLIRDTPPAGYNWTVEVVQAPANFFCNASSIVGGQLLECNPSASSGNVFTILNGGTVTIRLTSTTPATAASCNQISNTATVSSNVEASVNTNNNNSSTATVNVRCADVTVSKTTSTPTVQVGGQISYQIVATNNGPGTIVTTGLTTDAQFKARFRVWDTLPANFTWTVAESVANFACSPTGSGISGSTLVECFPQNANFTLGEGDSVTITLTSSAATIAACGAVPNIANVASNAEPTTGAGGNNNSTATATVACSDVTVVKTAVDGAGASVDEMQTGTPLRFRIVTTNTSTVTAQNVVTSDNLPNLSGVTWSEDSANCSIAGSNPQVLTCNWGSIPPTTGNTRTVTITGTYATGVVCGDVTNTATVTATNEPGSATGNNSSTDTVKVLCSDVTIVKTPDDGTARPGETISFTFSITNLGPDPATGVSVTDTLPGSVSEIWAVQPGSGVNCPATASGSLTCTLTSALAVGAGNARTVTVHRLATTSECVALNNSATVSATNEAATKTGNNTDTGKVTVLCTDISISKVGSPATINVGAPIKYTITVTNTGANALTIPTGALDAVREARLLVRDTLPANYTWTVSESVDNFACTPANPVAGGVEVKCAPANNTFTLAAGGSFTITIQSTTNVTAADCGKTIPNTSRVSSSMEPSTGAGTNNESTGNVTVQCTDVIVEKVTTTQILSVGGSIRYVIEVTNLGPGPVSSLTLTDNTLRSGLTWTPVENQTNWSCAVDGSNDLTCTFAGGTLGVGEKRTVTLTSSPTTTADCATFNNTAIVVSPDESAAAASNGNSSTATVTVQCADVVIEKTAPEAPVEVGAPIVFTMVVTNEGPGSITIPATADAAGRLARLEVRDTLPAGLNWTVTDDKENFSCTPVSPVTGGLTLSCSPTNNDFSFASGQTITITLTSTTTTVAQCPSVTNTGAVTSNAETTTMAANGNSSTATATVVCTDVTVLKTAVDDEGEAVESIQTGTPLIFEIVTTNSGSFAAHNVVTRDVLPNLEGVTWTVDNQTDCEISGDPLTLVCDWGSIPATTENTRTVTITGTYDTGDVCGDVANTATVTATNEPGSATGNNSSTDTVKVLCSDVVIDKTPDDGTVYPGGLISFTLTISNLGPDAATDVEVEDTLPGAATATWNVTAGDGVTCPATAQGVLVCTLASELAVGEEHARTITVSRQAEVADCALPNNSATVSATNEAADTQGNNTDTGKVTVLCADVMLEKDATSSTVLPGGLVEFTITVTNNGPASATDVVIEDTQLPDGEWTIDPGAGVTCEDETATGSFECTVDGLLPKDESRSVTVSRYAGATECTTLTNTAEVTSTNEPTTPEAVVLNNRDSASVEVLCTEISLIKSPDNGLVSPGTVDSPSLATFTIKVKNNGENDAVGVEVEDTLPPGSAPWTVTTTKGTCDSPATGSFECELGTLVPDEEVTITVKRNVTVADCGLLPNSATATATNDPTGVTDTGLITVTCSDVTVSKTPDSAAGPPAGHILPGATASFTVTLTNNGDFAAVGAKIEDYDLPDGVWDVTPGTGVTCPAATAEGSITCTVNDPVPVNGTRTVTFSRTTTTADCGLLENHARVSATNEDPDELTDNTESGSITVMCGEVGLEKTAVTASILPGATAEYWITVKSYGPFAAEDVEITDDLPGDGEWTIATQPDEAVSCPATATGSLSCEMTAPLAVDDEIRIHVSKVVTVEDCGPLRNEATVKISNERTTGELHSNTDDATVTVQCSDVALDKTATAASIYPGDKAEFTILVTNTGAFPATGVEIEDELPAGDWTFSSEISWESDTAELTCVSAASSVPAGSGVASGTLVCTLNETMPVGGNITITLSRETEAGECLDIDNEASVTATNEQPDGEGPNSDEATIEFRCTDIA